MNESHLFMKIIEMTAVMVPVVFYITLAIFILTLILYIFVYQNWSRIEQKSMLVKIPVAGKLIRLLNTHLFSIQLSYLFAGGLSILSALKVFEKNTHEPFYMELGNDLILQFSMGHDFEKAISDYPFFEKELSTIIKHGQENGKLDQELFFYSRHCLKQLEEKTEKGMKIIQPLIYTFIGLMVVSLYLAILLPMFQMIQGI